MVKIDLNGKWEMKNVMKEEWIDAIVPGTVFSDFLNAGLVEDPFYRDNEDKIQELFLEDYEYIREFEVLGSHLENDEVILCCEGLDTLADVYLNKQLIANTENMHRTYKFDVKNILVIGTNEIHIVFHSPKKYINSKAEFSKLPSVLGNNGLDHIRKAQCAFGWDWGLSLPDSGIWKNIFIECNSIAVIDEFYINQQHENDKVTLQTNIDFKIWSDKPLHADITVTGPDNKVINAKGQVDTVCKKYTANIEITDPKLWWPNGYGEQPLYEVLMLLKDGDTVIDTRKINIGLRTIVLRKENDEWGKSYEFVVNGKAIFIRGSNLIIEDSVVTRYSPKRTEKMLQDCVEANFNCVRVWGGAFYPYDNFYETCDKLGLIIYQDFMFACHAYPIYEEFLDNIREEIKDNVKRIRHHACLGLWSGNNEIETIIEMFTSKTEPLFQGIQEHFNCSLNAAEESLVKEEYKKLFAEVIPELLKELDPNTSYVRSSPSNDEFFERLENKGDSHYYIAFANRMPYKKQRDFYFRFVSEMGFQSYPSIKTIETFTVPEDRRPDSRIMYKHQKSNSGNQEIEEYMERDFKVPKDFGHYVYASQILAGEVLKYSVEHMRRNRGRCMGIITWQLNDCWPVVSWAGMDYFGRWKAQQYYSKRFYAPVLVSAAEEGQKADLYVTNDTFGTINGTLSWALKDTGSAVIVHGTKVVSIEPLSAKNCIQLDFSDVVEDFQPESNYLEFTLTSGVNELGSGTVIFVPAKEFKLRNPEIKVKVDENETSFLLSVTSAAYARSVGLDLLKADCIFSDNYFDVSANAVKVIEVKKSSLSEKLNVEQFRNQLKVISVYDIA